MRRSSSPIAALAAVAYAVILADLITKLFAVELIGERVLTVGGVLRLALVFNDDVGAFGLPAQAFGIELSTVLVFALIVLMLRVCRELSAVDRLAPLMLGLLAGAGAANHMDMLASSRGVADFIAIDGVGLQHIVFNVADIALLAGLVLCARSAILLVVRILEERSTAFAFAGAASASGAQIAARDPSTRDADPATRLPLFREPDATYAFRAPDHLPVPGGMRGLDGARGAPGDQQVAIAAAGMPADLALADGAPGGTRRGLLVHPSRFDRAATPALVIACSFIVLYSLAIVWLPDAGRSAPSALLLALGVFGTVFVAVYSELALAERRAARAAKRAAVRIEREREIERVTDGHVPAEPITRRERPDQRDEPRAFGG